MIDRLATPSLLTMTAGTAAVTSVSTGTVWGWLLPVLCGCLAAAIVRGISITTPRKKRRVWVFEALVTALSVLLTGVIVHDQAYSIMYATFVGTGVGGLGVGVITIARSAAANMITNMAKAILSANTPPNQS